MPGIENLEPKLVWKHFDEIRKIPRCSKHEEKIREYIMNFAKNQGLKTKVDQVGNVVILKPATPGMENKPTVVLQGHMDMVCEKNSDVTFDFSKDPIQLKITGDLLTANGTTLGADNGIGLAISLAILEDKTVRHGPIESLYTIDEETGLTGAFAMKPDMLTGKIMLNLDSEDFGVITVGCAGGGDSTLELPVHMQPVLGGSEHIVVKVFGLRGGHSGVDIHEQRGNAIKILTRLLWKASQKCDFFIFDVKGGDKHNAIPREAYAKIAIETKHKNTFVTELKAEEKDIYEEIKPIDPGFKVDVRSCESAKTTVDKPSQTKLLNLVHGLPHGVHQMNYDIKTLVNTSTNLATISMKENAVVIGMSSRSPMKSALQDMRDRIRAIASLSGAKVSEGTPYPGWKPDLQSKILALSKKIFKDMFKQEPKIEAIHAGLECGIIGEKFPGMDMISIGPTLKNPHSPEEQLHISTVGKFYNFLLKVLEAV
ncbi:MAG: cytosol nonspecific dipeptidase [Thermoplasmata archaeon M11B2D]|nr:MAG: cytosol nonspecific dipeptidase [Thermoplasmata archaeon M11B2D]PNX53105.1 MAG: cytosol nonspecific dipeptidase [Thermoplasmata archaeon M9B2D]